MIKRLIISWQSSAKLRLATMTIIAFTLWSAWSFYANYSHGFSTAFVAALAQGIQSAVSTLFGSALIEWLYRKLKTIRFSLLWVTAIATTCSFTFMYSVHWVVGTPEILLTIMPVTTMALFYCFSYTLSLTKPVAMTSNTH